MRDPVVKPHRFSEVVVAALRTTQCLGEGSPQAMARATKAIVEADNSITLSEAFHIV